MGRSMGRSMGLRFDTLRKSPVRVMSKQRATSSKEKRENTNSNLQRMQGPHGGPYGPQASTGLGSHQHDRASRPCLPGGQCGSRHRGRRLRGHGPTKGRNATPGLRAGQRGAHDHPGKQAARARAARAARPSAAPSPAMRSPLRRGTTCTMGLPGKHGNRRNRSRDRDRKPAKQKSTPQPLGC